MYQFFLAMMFVALSACIHTPNLIEADDDQSVALAEEQQGLSITFSHFKMEIQERLPLVEAVARLGARDQLVRHMINEWRNRPEMNATEKEAFINASSNFMSQIDEANTKELKRLLRGISWKELSDAGGDLFIKAFFVVQHSPDYEFQSNVLNELEPLVSEGLIDAQQYVYLFDRVKLRNGDLQLYGTQMECVDGQYAVINLQAPETVDQRRTEVGLQPLAEYTEFVREFSGPCEPSS